MRHAELQRGHRLGNSNCNIWRPALSEPLWVGFGLKTVQCGCGQKFKSKQAYIEHYIYWAVWQNESGYIPSLLKEGDLNTL
jgi:hypothetical protein